MKIERLTPDLHRLGNIGMVNCFLVREEDGFTLVDASLPGAMGAILRAAEGLGGAIRRIVLTHGHFDHVGATDELVERLPGVELLAGERESRLMAGDFSLEAGERGGGLFGFRRVKTNPARLLQDGERVGSLRVVNSPGHSPGHIAFLDERDGSLFAGDAFTTHGAVLAAGTFRWWFPMAAFFAWNAELAARSAERLADLRPELLAVGHGPCVANPAAPMRRAVDAAYKQHPKSNT